MPADPRQETTTGRIALASMVGTAIEFHDFYISRLLHLTTSTSHDFYIYRVRGPAGRVVPVRPLQRPEGPQTDPGLVTGRGGAVHYAYRRLAHLPPGGRPGSGIRQPRR